MSVEVGLVALGFSGAGVFIKTIHFERFRKAERSSHEHKLEQGGGRGDCEDLSHDSLLKGKE
jgi:hypothetical protein